MGYPKSSVFLLLSILLFVLVSAHSVKATEYNEIEKEVLLLLQTRNLTDLANELAANNSTSTKDLLIKISVFGRAGHRFRVKKVLQDLVPKVSEIEAEDAKNQGATSIRSRFLETISRAISDDFESIKIFFEKFKTWGGDGAKGFIDYWKKNGDVEEIEKWLFERKHLVWWRDEWIRLKVELGTADVIYDQLEQVIRKNPSDFDKIQEYLSLVRNKRDVLWLLDVVPTNTAYNTYLLANQIGTQNSSIKLKLLEKSLTLPFAKDEEERFIMDCAMRTQSGIVPKNPEKQLRFWTKKALIDIHHANKQPILAQPYAEQLADLDTSDILWKDEIFVTAGMTQASSGKRVIETQILQSEAEKKNSPQYWIERAKYYKGRKEDGAVLETIEKALKTFLYNPKDEKILSNRYEILYEIKWGVLPQEKLVEIYLKELRNSRKNYPYFVKMSYLALNPYDEVREKCLKFFADSDILIEMLGTRSNWNGQEHQIIQSIMDSDLWTKEKKDQVWEKLVKLARKNPDNLRLIASKMVRAEKYKRAIPLLLESQKIVREGEFAYSERENIKDDLFESYKALGDWRKLEEMVLNGYGRLENQLPEVANIAALGGNISESIRIWKNFANYDRRLFYYLSSLGKTSAKPLLREFYLEMKQKDPLSDIPDKALQILK